MAQSNARNTDPRYSKLAIGVCPDQWGVWFPEDPKQIPWETDRGPDGHRKRRSTSRHPPVPAGPR